MAEPVTTAAGGEHGPAPAITRSLRIDGDHTIVIRALDGYEFRVDADFTTQPFTVLLDGHRIDPNLGRLLASALAGLAWAVDYPPPDRH